MNTIPHDMDGAVFYLSNSAEVDCPLLAAASIGHKSPDSNWATILRNITALTLDWQQTSIDFIFHQHLSCSKFAKHNDTLLSHTKLGNIALIVIFCNKRPNSDYMVVILHKEQGIDYLPRTSFRFLYVVCISGFIRRFHK